MELLKASGNCRLEFHLIASRFEDGKNSKKIKNAKII